MHGGNSMSLALGTRMSCGSRRRSHLWGPAEIDHAVLWVQPSKWTLTETVLKDTDRKQVRIHEAVRNRPVRSIGSGRSCLTIG